MLLALLSIAAAAPIAPCGTPLFLELRDGPLGTAPPAPPSATKAERDAWGSYPNTLTSPNFVLKWGTRGSVTEDEAQALLDAFEDSWAVEIAEMGHPAPTGTDRWLFNVYIGDTGSGTPSGNGTAGYYWRDDDEQPYVVISRDMLYYPEFAQGTAAHEFYHAVQDGLGSYGYGDGNVGAWYWEATAEWAQGEVFPDNPSYAGFLFGYAWLPELPVGFFDYPDQGTLEEYHQYGAFIFPRYLSEVAVDRQIVVDSWVDSGGQRDPLDVLSADLEARGTSMADVFGAFAAHNAAWDYRDGAVYEDALDEWVGWYDDSTPNAAVVEEEGTDGFVAVPAASAPQRLGYAIVRIEAGEGTWRVRFDGDDAGSAGTAPAWRVTVVEDAEAAYLEVEEGGEVEIGEGLWHLVVAAVPDRSAEGETFGFSYAVEAIEEEDSGRPRRDGAHEGEEAAACGCSAGDGLGAGWFVGVVLLATRRGRAR